MTAVAIVTDSSSCLPADVLERYGIIVVPMTVQMGGETYRDSEMEAAQLYSELRTGQCSPTSSAPAPGEFLIAYRKARDTGAESALCLTMSARYSGTHDSAVNAQNEARREMPGFRIDVVDTKCVAMAHGFAVRAAAEAVGSGASIEEAGVAAKELAARVQLVGALDGTAFLAKSGRIPWIAHWVASLLRFRPVITAKGEKIGAIGRPRTREGALACMLAYFDREVRSRGRTHVAVLHADAPQRAEELAVTVRGRVDPAELFVTEFSTVMGVHTGPDFLGLAFYTEPSV